MADPAVKPFNPWLIAFYSGLASMAGDMIMYPIDTIGTRIKAHKEKFLTFKQGYNLIVKNEGFKFLFKGFSTTVGGSFIPYGSYFLVYEWLNSKAVKMTRNDDGSKSKWNLLIPLVTSPLAEIVSVITYIPFDTIRTRMQMNLPEYQYKGVMEGMSRIHEQEGLIRLFQASHLYMVQVVIFTTFQMWFYELLRYEFLHQNVKKGGKHDQPLKLHESLIATMISTCIATTIVNPVDLIITRFQLVDSSITQLSTKAILTDLLLNEGKKALFKGLGARVVNSTLFSMLYFPVYDHFKSKYGICLAD